MKMYCKLAVLMAEKDPNLTQKKLCSETGLSRQTLTRLFNNRFDRVDTSTVVKLCTYFGRDVGDLFELREDEVAVKDEE